MIINEDNFIEELKNKNEDALFFVIDNYLPVLKTVINKHLFYLEDRKEECINDCLFAIWNNIDAFDRSRSSFTNWIAGIAKYKSIDYIRKYLADRTVEDIDNTRVQSGEDSLNSLLEKEFQNQVNDLLSHLSEEDKEIFIETYFYNKTAKEISNNINLSESNIHNRLSRGRYKLKKLIGGDFNDR